MNFVLLGILTFSTGVFAAKKCAKELEKIVYGPETYAKQYLTKLNDKLRSQTRDLFNPVLQASTIGNFENAYGVQVTLRNPFVYDAPAVCKTVPSSNIGTIFPGVAEFTVSIDDNVIIQSISVVNFQLAYVPLKSTLESITRYNASIISPSNTVVTFYNENCPNLTNIYGSFSDSATEYIDCGDATSQDTWLPSPGPFSNFAGESSNGVWTLRFDSVGGGAYDSYLNTWGLNYCYGETLIANPSNWAESNLNFDGFRNDAGTFYLTSIYRNVNGELLYVTLSTSNLVLFSK